MIWISSDEVKSKKKQYIYSIYYTLDYIMFIYYTVLLSYTIAYFYINAEKH